jgi:hypothetical protein
MADSAIFYTETKKSHHDRVSTHFWFGLQSVMLNVAVFLGLLVVSHITPTNSQQMGYVYIVLDVYYTLPALSNCLATRRAVSLDDAA